MAKLSNQSYLVILHRTAQQQLQEANKNLAYVLLPDIRGGKMDTAAHQFRGREEEVLRITLEWLKKHKLSP